MIRFFRRRPPEPPRPVLELRPVATRFTSDGDGPATFTVDLPVDLAERIMLGDGVLRVRLVEDAEALR